MLARVLVVGCAVLAIVPAATAGPADDRYLAGYVAAVLERELDVRDADVDVRDGAVTVRVPRLAGRDRAAIEGTLGRVRGVVSVSVVDREESVEGAVRTAATPRGEFLPRGELFRPLVADPRWPRFSATYRYYVDDRDFRDVGSANFGATMPLYRHAAFPAGRWEAGLQAGVFSIFDLDAPSKDLVNADYFVAVLGSWATESFAAMGRVFHQSSHLGDEFLLRGRVRRRLNLSYEALDLKLSYEVLPRTLRLYGGAGYLFDQEPADLEPWGVQYGIEATSPWALDTAGAVTPIVAADFQNHEESDWSGQYSLLAGLRLEHVRVAGSALLLGAEWFRGHSPNGQFYGREVEWTGVGLHLFF